MVRSLAIQLEIYLTQLTKRSGRNSLLSESPSDFIIDPDNSTQTIDMLRSNQHDFGHTTFYLSFGVRPGRKPLIVMRTNISILIEITLI